MCRQLRYECPHPNPRPVICQRLEGKKSFWTTLFAAPTDPQQCRDYVVKSRPECSACASQRNEARYARRPTTVVVAKRQAVPNARTHPEGLRRCNAVRQPRPEPHRQQPPRPHRSDEEVSAFEVPLNSKHKYEPPHLRSALAQATRPEELLFKKGVANGGYDPRRRELRNHSKQTVYERQQRPSHEFSRDARKAENPQLESRAPCRPSRGGDRASEESWAPGRENIRAERAVRDSSRRDESSHRHRRINNEEANTSRPKEGSRRSKKRHIQDTAPQPDGLEKSNSKSHRKGSSESTGKPSRHGQGVLTQGRPGPRQYTIHNPDPGYKPPKPTPPLAVGGESGGCQGRLPIPGPSEHMQPGEGFFAHRSRMAKGGASMPYDPQANGEANLSTAEWHVKAMHNVEQLMRDAAAAEAAASRPSRVDMLWQFPLPDRRDYAEQARRRGFTHNSKHRDSLEEEEEERRLSLGELSKRVKGRFGRLRPRPVPSEASFACADAREVERNSR